MNTRSAFTDRSVECPIFRRNITLTGRSLNGSRWWGLRTAPATDEPAFLWQLVSMSTAGHWQLSSDDSFLLLDMQTVSLKAALPELSQTAGPPGYAFCADAWDDPNPPALGMSVQCNFKGPTRVAYGAGGQWTYKDVGPGRFDCKATNFDVNPGEAVPKACFFAPRIAASALSSYFASTPCAAEGGSCWTGDRPRVLAFGRKRADGGMAFTYVRVPSSTQALCGLTLTHFDPAPNEAKECYLSLDGAPVGDVAPFVPCAKKGEVCSFEGTALVAFGGQDGISGEHDFTYKTLANSAYCHPSTFGVDPLPDQQTSCHYLYMGPPKLDAPASQCASEHGNCHVGPANSIVAYGIDASWAFRDRLTNDVDCSNHFFGDPAVGRDKVCWAVRSEYKYCANENSACQVPLGAVVAYGVLNGVSSYVHPRFIYRTRDDGGFVTCSNGHFGSDPAPGTPKQCWFYVPPLESAPPAGFTYCAREDLQSPQTCRIGADRAASVAFGAHGHFIYLPRQVGDILCNGQSFGGNIDPNIDPLPGVVKGCYYRLY